MTCVMFVSTLGFLSDGEDDEDSRSTPGSEMEPASTGCWEGVAIIEMRGKGNSFPLMERGIIVEMGSHPSPSLAVLSCLTFRFKLSVSRIITEAENCF